MHLSTNNLSIFLLTKFTIPQKKEKEKKDERRRINGNITYCKLEETWILALFLSQDINYVYFQTLLEPDILSPVFSLVYNIYF